MQIRADVERKLQVVFPPIAIAIAGLAMVVAAAAGHEQRRRRRHQLREAPFPSEWETYLVENVALYNKLPEELQSQLKGYINVFLDEKDFEGCGGLEVTDEMRVTIAGLASILLLNKNTTYYPDLKSVLVYPSAYIVEGAAKNAREVSEQAQVRLGESWVDGVVVLSWSDVTRTSHDPKDGHNLVLHEFAHQLDQEDGRGDGVPSLEHKSQYLTWATVLSREFDILCAKTAKGKRTVMDSYGATNPAEFFAVATETFFEKPRQMNKKHPELYAELKEFYQLDPLEWRG